MRYEIDACCDCGLPCLGNSCSLSHVPKFKCDICGEDDWNLDDLHEIDGDDVCPNCYEDMNKEDDEEDEDDD